MRACLEACQDYYATCTVETPSWGRQEYVSIELQVNKVEAGVTGFLFYNQPTITYARPHFVIASETSTVTLKGANLPSPSGLNLRTGPSSSETIFLGETTTIRMRCCATLEVLQTLEPVLAQGHLTVQVGRVAMTGSAYFEVSLNGVDFDETFSRWNNEWLLLTKHGATLPTTHAKQVEAKMHDASICFWETPLPLDVEPRLLIMPPKNSEAFYARKAVRILCSGYKVVNTGAGKVVVNVAERTPAHVLAVEAAAKAAAVPPSALTRFINEREGGGQAVGLFGGGEEDVDGHDAVGGGVAVTVCSHDVVAQVEEGGESVTIILPELEAVGEIDLEFCVSCDGGRTFSAPCPNFLQIRYANSLPAI